MKLATLILHYELELFGIKVVLVEPGFIKTNFAQAISASSNLLDI